MLHLLLRAACCVVRVLPAEVTDASCNEKASVFDKPQGRKLAMF
jgi:hypothetical protein